ncbi:uncharacterized protein J8A68_002213 [[Candida] subhashii]|uniref:Flo11 domain-containing protein n=1 Tax=[Candida] subhashii TaxID=561895 RepID=A0A8J5QDT8_9ASCO|nr:uncharacterized protein J8A68_002213 [[Candida] subhashii]KAG7664244.1 hypothetical protein J8A68_002213 [[Candida] subhashii]
MRISELVAILTLASLATTFKLTFFYHATQYIECPILPNSCILTNNINMADEFTYEYPNLLLDGKIIGVGQYNYITPGGEFGSFTWTMSPEGDILEVDPPIYRCSYRLFSVQNNNCELVKEFNVLGYVPLVPSEETTEPPEETTEPSDETTEPSEETTEPSEETTERSDETTEPSEETTEQSEETTEPSDETTEPSDETTEPSDETTEPSDETTEPSDETIEPSDETTEPSEETTEPSDETTEPSEETTEPSEETMELSDETIEPSEETTEQSEETTEPSDEATEPSDKTTESSDETTEPSEEETTEPSEDTTGPSEVITEPSESTTEPTSEVSTTEPTWEESTTEPTSETTEPTSEESITEPTSEESSRTEPSSEESSRTEPNTEEKTTECKDDNDCQTCTTIQTVYYSSVEEVHDTLTNAVSKSEEQVCEEFIEKVITRVIQSTFYFETITVNNNDASDSTGRSNGEGDVGREVNPSVVAGVSDYAEVGTRPGFTVVGILAFMFWFVLFV